MMMPHQMRLYMEAMRGIETYIPEPTINRGETFCVEGYRYYIRDKHNNVQREGLAVMIPDGYEIVQSGMTRHQQDKVWDKDHNKWVTVGTGLSVGLFHIVVRRVALSQGEFNAALHEQATRNADCVIKKTIVIPNGFQPVVSGTVHSGDQIWNGTDWTLIAMRSDLVGMNVETFRQVIRLKETVLIGTMSDREACSKAIDSIQRHFDARLFQDLARNGWWEIRMDDPKDDIRVNNIRNYFQGYLHGRA